MTVVRYLVVDSTGKARTTVNWPALRPGEWVWRLCIDIPDAYGDYAHVGDLELTVPEPGPPDLEAQLLGTPTTSQAVAPPE